MSSENQFLFKCVLYSILNSGSFMIATSFSALAVPLNHLFNKTSVEMFDIHDDGSLLTSTVTLLFGLGCVLSILFIIPLTDTMGRKFVCVELKFAMTSLAAISIVVGFLLQSSLAYTVGLMLIQGPSFIRLMADPIYLAELSPGTKHRGFISISINTISIVVGQSIVLTLCREEIWGNDDQWYYIILIAQGFNLAMYALGLTMDESPQWEKGNKDHRIIGFRGRALAAKEMLSNRDLRKIMIPIIVVMLVNFWSPTVFEYTYPIQMYSREGMNTDQVLTMNLITTILGIPYNCLGPSLVDKMNRCCLVLLAILLNISKSMLHIAGWFLPGVILPYANVVLAHLFSGAGLGSLPFLMCAEALPSEDRIIASQLILIIGMSSQNILSIGFPMLLDYLPLIYTLLILVSLILFVLVWMFVGGRQVIVREEVAVCEKTPLLV